MAAGLGLFPLLGHAAGKVAAWGDNYAGQCLLPNGLKNVKAISAGGTHSLALKTDGTVVAWGQNTYGQCDVPAGLSGVVAVSAGSEHSVALKADGTVVAWGYGGYDRTNVPPGLTGVKAISAGGAHTLALKSDGTVAVWGSLPSFYSNTNPPTGLSNVVAVAAGEFHSLALRADGTVVAWGYGGYGQISVPVGLSNVIAIAAGAQHSLALKADGTVVAWGGGYYGSTNVPTGLSNVVAISAGEFSNLALKSDGSLVAWGGESYGLTNILPATAQISAIDCGSFHNLAIVSEGPPEITQQPADLNVDPGSNAVLSVTADGFEPLSYQWFRDGAALTDSDRLTGTTTKSLSLLNAQLGDIGIYTVIVSNAFGLVQSTGAVLTVIVPPMITQEPVDLTAIAGADVTLSVKATGTPPLKYQWLLNGLEVSGAHSNRLDLPNVQSSQGGIYTVVVSNAFGRMESSDALVTVLESTPYILKQPTNVSVLVGGSVVFSVTARGSTPLHYQWRFNGADIPDATNSTLALGPLTYGQEGYYVALSVTSSAGSSAQKCT